MAGVASTKLDLDGSCSEALAYVHHLGIVHRDVKCAPGQDKGRKILTRKTDKTSHMDGLMGFPFGTDSWWIFRDSMLVNTGGYVHKKKVFFFQSWGWVKICVKMG